MGELEDNINEIGRYAALRIAYESSGRLYSLSQFSIGDLVTIDLVGENMEGVQIEPDQIILGRITSNRMAQIEVIEAPDQRNLVSRTIGLGVHTDIATPGGIVLNQNIKGCVAPKRTCAYYFLEDIMPTSPYQYPSTFHVLAARYGRVIVEDMTLFDVIRGGT